MKVVDQAFKNLPDCVINSNSTPHEIAATSVGAKNNIPVFKSFTIDWI